MEDIVNDQNPEFCWKGVVLGYEIAAFEAWQQTPDEDETFSAIHVALLLSRETPCRNPLQ